MYQPDPTSSRTVDWWAVNSFVDSLLASVGAWPMAGTAEWSALPDGDTRKLAALLDAARHWALRVDTYQEAMAETSKDIAAAADWSAAAGRLTERRPASYVPRKKAS